MAGLNVGSTGGKRTKGIAPARGDGPLVSIITVVYNGAATLERTIRSVLSLSYPNIEYIIIDGGSSDGTLELLKRYEDRIDLWVSEKDQGIYDAMNKGLALCTGDWIGLINADDHYDVDAVQWAMDAGSGKPEINIVHGDILIAYPNGQRKVKHAKRSGFLLKYWEMVFNHPSFFVRRSYYADHLFDLRFRICGDHAWTLRAYLEKPDQFLYVPKPLATFTIGGASTTIPLRKVLDERWRMSRALGMNLFASAFSVLVRVLFYFPQFAKLRYNQLAARG